jgi:hypothetical protein
MPQSLDAHRLALRHPVVMAFPFRSRTLGMLTRTIDMAYSNTRIGTLLLDAEADRWDPPNPRNKQDRLQRLFRAMREDGGEDAEAAALETARLLMSSGASSKRRGRPMVWWDEALDTLATDGWEYDIEGDRLVPTVPGVRVAEETSFLEADLIDRNWKTTAGHYRQALDAFSRGDWAATNSMLRSLLEDLLPAAAALVSGKRPKQPRASIDVLRSNGVLVEGEFDLLKGLWEMSQHRGPHAGLSDADEARFRLVTVTAHCRFLLVRLPA